MSDDPPTPMLITIVAAHMRARSQTAIHAVATASYRGQVYSARGRDGAICDVARHLVAGGCPDLPWQVVDRHGEPSLCGPSLHGLAKLD
jgi:hypothetical protein